MKWAPLLGIFVALGLTLVKSQVVDYAHKIDHHKIDHVAKLGRKNSSSNDDRDVGKPLHETTLVLYGRIYCAKQKEVSVKSRSKRFNSLDELYSAHGYAQSQDMAFARTDNAEWNPAMGGQQPLQVVGGVRRHSPGNNNNNRADYNSGEQQYGFVPFESKAPPQPYKDMQQEGWHYLPSPPQQQQHNQPWAAAPLQHQPVYQQQPKQPPTWQKPQQSQWAAPKPMASAQQNPWSGSAEQQAPNLWELEEPEAVQSPVNWVPPAQPHQPVYVHQQQQSWASPPQHASSPPAQPWMGAPQQQQAQPSHTKPQHQPWMGNHEQPSQPKPQAPAPWMGAPEPSQPKPKPWMNAPVEQPKPWMNAPVEQPKPHPVPHPVQQQPHLPMPQESHHVHQPHLSVRRPEAPPPHHSVHHQHPGAMSPSHLHSTTDAEKNELVDSKDKENSWNIDPFIESGAGLTRTEDKSLKSDGEIPKFAQQINQDTRLAKRSAMFLTHPTAKKTFELEPAKHAVVTIYQPKTVGFARINEPIGRVETDKDGYFKIEMKIKDDYAFSHHLTYFSVAHQCPLADDKKLQKDCHYVSYQPLLTDFNTMSDGYSIGKVVVLGVDDQKGRTSTRCPIPGDKLPGFLEK